MNTIILIFFLSLFTPRSDFSATELAEEIVFVVNVENPATEISSNDVSDFYFKRKRYWPNRESVRFIDRNPENSIRSLFLKKFLKKSSSEVEQFWIGQKLYTGDSAPLRESSDAGTIKFCSSFKGALGYISATTAAGLTNKNIKVIKVNSKGD